MSWRRKVGLHVLGAISMICLGILMVPGVAEGEIVCVSATSGCSNTGGDNCLDWVCYCMTVPTTLPDEGGCGGEHYERITQGCGACATKIGDLACGFRCGAPKAVPSGACW